MKLLPDWKLVARRSWSFWLSVLAAILGAAEVGVQLMAAVRPTPFLAMAAAVISLLASLARLFRQPSMHDERAK